MSEPLAQPSENSAPPQLTPRAILHELGSTNKSSGSILVIGDRAASADEAANLAQFFSKDFHLYAYGSDLPADIDCLDAGVAFAAQLEAMKAKRLTIFALGRGTALAQALCLADRSIIRRLVLVDAYVSPARTFREKAISFLGKLLPAGFPVEPGGPVFDLRPHIHRLRPPALLLVSKDAPANVVADASLMLQRVPNCRQRSLRQPIYTDSNAISLEISKLLRDFMEVPVKRSQKGGAAE